MDKDMTQEVKAGLAAIELVARWVRDGRDPEKRHEVFSRAFDHLTCACHLMVLAAGWFNMAVHLEGGCSEEVELSLTDQHDTPLTAPEEVLPPGLLLALRLEVALRNKDMSMADALWETVHTQGVKETVMVQLLTRAAERIAPFMGFETN